MLPLKDRIEILSSLPELVQKDSRKEDFWRKAKLENPYFIPEFIQNASDALLNWHQKNTLTQWLLSIQDPKKSKKIGLVLAGNIPLVGWHDLMAVFGSGHIACFKLSKKDAVLIRWWISLLTENFPEVKPYFQEVERLQGVDGLIATGSSQTAVHFDYYFRHVPRIIRGSKSSLGLIYGFETEEEIRLLTQDVMVYFGMGCRNVTKILVPEGYDFQALLNTMEGFRFFTDHHQYVNNCIYHKAIFLMNGDPFYESDMVILRPSTQLFSPVGVINFEEYASLEHAKSIISKHKKDIQCLVSHQGQLEGSIPFGQAQNPGIEDYADGINTLHFLQNLS